MNQRKSSDDPQKHKVKVVVRVRPQLEKDDQVWVQVTDTNTLTTLNHRNTNESLQYEFESVFGPSSNQALIYKDCVKPTLNKALEGQNASVFAYGPTGAGKTHTILGTAADPGIIPRCVKDIFLSIKKQGEKTGKEWKFDVQFSYLEIYQEKVNDLLNVQPHPVDLPIREDQHHNIFVTGLSEKSISNVEEFNQLFGPASNNRTTAATKLNERSSRSHSILILKVTRTQTTAPFKRLVGKMCVIDLAGSEDNRRTGNQGVRLKESGAINSSLLALSQVVDALHKNKTCVPYRSSKLTRLLQDSLGGSAHTCMIVNLAPEERYYYDTYTTLNFARKTKKVVNTVKTNESVVKNSLNGGKKRSRDSKSPLTQSETPKRQRLDPAPFLSPLLRDQERFRSDLKTEVFSRLEALEGRILNQMKSTEVEEKIQSQEKKHQKVTVDRLDNLMHELEDFKTTSKNKPDQKTTGTSRKTKVYADGSTIGKTFVDVTNSPLFVKPSSLKRKGFSSTAAKQMLDSSASKSVRSSVMNPALQNSHNDQILMILNSGTVKELQELQTVGAKRAKLIHSWREHKGNFTKFEDLTAIPGLTSKYLDKFLQSNLVQNI